MDLLRTLAAVADTGSFTSAARRVHRTQAAVSQQVRRLEEQAGCALFARQARGAALTAQGETLLRYARRILRLHDEAMAAVARPEVAGVVRLGAPEDYASLYLPGILSRFAAGHPRVRVDVSCRTSPELLAMLGSGDLDLTLATGPVHVSHSAGPGEVVHRQRVVWACAKGFDPCLEDPLPLALFHHGCLYRHWALAALDKAGLAWRVAFSSPSLAGVLAAVRAGLGVAPLAASVVGPGVRVLEETPADGTGGGPNAQGPVLPPLPEATVSLVGAQGGAAVVTALAGHVRREFRRLGPVAP